MDLVFKNKKKYFFFVQENTIRITKDMLNSFEEHIQIFFYILAIVRSKNHDNIGLSIR